MRGPLRIDEAHKIADTFFFRLLLERDFGHPAWFSHIVDRTNPAFGKFLFGAAASLGGAPLADRLSIREEFPNGKLGQRMQPDDLRRYAATLRACRQVSLVASSLTVAIVVLLTLRAFGTIAALIAGPLYATAYLVQTFAATAVYDALLALTFVAALALVQNLSSRPRDFVSCCVLAVVCAAAVDLRLSGVVALVFSGAAIVWLAARDRRRARVIQLAVVVGGAAFLAVLFNPFYWATPRPSSAVPDSLRSERAGPKRIIHRVTLQVDELGQILAREEAEQGMLRGLQRLRFASEHLAGDLVGLATVAGICLIALPHSRGRSNANGRLTATWCAAMVLLNVAALPLAWPRYLLPAAAPLAILGAAGWAGFSTRMMQMRRDPSERLQQ